jgi:putative ABC transport system substrate-binding protein
MRSLPINLPSPRPRPGRLAYSPSPLSYAIRRTITRALSAAAAGRVDAVLPLMSPVFFRERVPLLEWLATHRLPAIFGQREFVGAGGLIAYGASFDAMFRRAADYVDRIVKGTKPSDLPVEQPLKFELVLNFKTAKALGITFPPTLLIRADEVLQ